MTSNMESRDLSPPKRCINREVLQNSVGCSEYRFLESIRAIRSESLRAELAPQCDQNLDFHLPYPALRTIANSVIGDRKSVV